MKKRMLAAAALMAALAVLCLAGCGSSASDENYREGLPAWADEAAVTEQAREIIELRMRAISTRWLPVGMTGTRPPRSWSKAWVAPSTSSARSRASLT